jgi:prepilin-type N-terminal cleavage/methylation domain-containing protein
MHYGPRRRLPGFTIVELMIVVAIIGLLAAIFIPNVVRARRRSTSTTCIGNLRIIDTAVQELKIERPNLPLVQDNISIYIGRGDGGHMPTCPAGGLYGDFDRLVSCSFQDTRFEHALPE